MTDPEPPHSAGNPVTNILGGLRMLLSPKLHDSINNTPDPPQANTTFSGQRPLICGIPRHRGSKRVQLTQNARRAKLNSLIPGEDNDELETVFYDMSDQPDSSNSADDHERSIADIEDHGRIDAGSIPNIRMSRGAVGLGVSISSDSDSDLGLERTMDVWSGTHNYRQGALAARMASRDDCPPTSSLSGSSGSFDSGDDNESLRARARRLKHGNASLFDAPRNRFQLGRIPLLSPTISRDFAFENISPSPSPPQTPRPSYSRFHSKHKSEGSPLPVTTPPRIRRRVFREAYPVLQLSQQRTVTQDFASWLHQQACRSARRTASRAAKERCKGKTRLCDRRSINISPINTTRCSSTHWSMAKVGHVDDVDFSTPGWTCGSNCTDRIQVVLVLQGTNSIGCDCPYNMFDERSDNVEVGTCREDEDWSDDDGFLDRGKKGAEEQEQMWVRLERMRSQDHDARSGKDGRQRDVERDNE
ncbi:hypothetical protein BJ875DRAFT_481100 [Amylocarpus encephaloides]|uniref:Uncharacterized protein n=1 Tax=Amylocarpus encephaloides TaxID=45428 RepID=A0A9P7YQ03_9HELO|nr:hypothetical protein BJ875DRAFT_481100 [Amylocarpus encephaloides]